MNASKILVYYPGHLGPEPTTKLRGGMRAVRWTRGKSVLLPREDALDLVRLQGFLQAEPLAACAERTGLGKRKIRAVARVEGKGADALVILDTATSRALRAAAAAPPDDSDDAGDDEEPALSGTTTPTPNDGAGEPPAGAEE